LGFLRHTRHIDILSIGDANGLKID
jgi:hypothetical protein